MHCPFCECANTNVVDSRDSGANVRRRRECTLCRARFTTYERVQLKALTVVKRDGRREPFNRDKLLTSLTTACAKRPLPTSRIERLVNEVEEQMHEQGRAELSSGVIGELVMDRLAQIDRVAYIRFASVYRDFRDIERFKSEIDAMLGVDDAPVVNTDQLPLPENEAGAGHRPKRRRGRPPGSVSSVPKRAR